MVTLGKVYSWWPLLLLSTINNCCFSNHFLQSFFLRQYLPHSVFPDMTGVLALALWQSSGWVLTGAINTICSKQKGDWTMRKRTHLGSARHKWIFPFPPWDVRYTIPQLCPYPQHVSKHRKPKLYEIFICCCPLELLRDRFWSHPRSNK